MSDEYWLRRYVVRPLAVPADAIVTFGYVIGANAVLFASSPEQVAVRSLVGLPLLFFLPGYATVSALFPYGPDGTAGGFDPDPDPLADGTLGGLGAKAHTTIQLGRTFGIASRGLGTGERAALSVGTSLALLPLIGLVHAIAGLGYGPTTVITSLSATVVVGTVVGIAHRRQIPPENCYTPPIGRTIGAAQAAVSGDTPRVDVFLNVLVAVTAIVALASVSYAVVVPNGDASSTSASLLTENANGTLVAGGYPATIDEGGASYVVRVESREGDAVRYGVVTELQRVETADDGLRVVERREVSRARPRVTDGGTWTQDLTVAPPPYGEDLRLVVYIYRGAPPETPDTSSAYRHVSVRVDAPQSAAG